MYWKKLLRNDIRMFENIFVMAVGMLGDDYFGKIMVLTFNDDEEDMFQRIMSYVNVGTKCLEVADTPLNILRFKELEINESERIVIKKARKLILLL